MDTFPGSAGNDTITATNATLGAFDSINGGAGVDTLNITDVAAVTALVGSISNVEKLVVNSASSVGAVGVEASAGAKGVNTLSFANPPASTDKYTVVINGVSYTSNVVASTDAAGAAGAVAAVINAVLGTGTATVFGGTVIVSGSAVGTAMPAITATGTDTAASVSAAAVSVAPSPATAAVTAATFDATGKGFTTLDVKAAAASAIKADKTTDVTIAITKGAVSLDGAKSATVSAMDSVAVKNIAGAVVIDQTKATTVATVATTVEGGTSVSVKQIGATLNATKDAAATANNAAINVGVSPTVGSGATTSGYPEVIANIAKESTGNVEISQATSFTNAQGLARVAYGTGAVTSYTNGATTVSVTGGNTATITDVQTTALKATATGTAAAGTSTLAAVSLAGTQGAVAINSDALTKLSVIDSANTATAVTITNNTVGGHALGLTVGNNASGMTVTDAKATSVAINSITTVNGAQTGSASNLTLSAGEATALSFSNAQKVTLNGSSTLTKVAAVTSTNSGALDLGDLSGLTKLASIDASAATGGVTVAIGATPAAAGMVVKGGAGNDVITVKGAIGSTTATNGGLVTTTITLGAGNDSLLKGTNGSVIAGASIDAGDGIDTLSATLFTAGNSAVFKNFEILDLNGAGTSSFDASLLTNSTISGVAISSDITGTATVSNIAGTNLTVNVTGAGSLGSLVATLKTSAGTADTAFITFAADGFAISTTNTLTAVTTTGLETIGIASGGTAAAGSAATVVATNVITTLTDTANATATVNVTGASAFQLGAYTDAATSTSGFAQNTAATTATADVTAALKMIDGSAATGALTIVAGTSATITSPFVTKYDGLTINGGSANDRLVNNAKAGVVNGGAGDDTIVITGAGATANGGAGADTIYASGSKEIVDVGAADGKVDSVILSLATEFTGATNTSVFTPTSALTTVSNLAKGDTININAFLTTAATANLGKFDASSFTTLEAAVNAAITSATKAVDFFTWADGNTYIVVNGSTSGADATANLNDTVIKLVGSYDLTTATAAAGVITLG